MGCASGTATGAAKDNGFERVLQDGVFMRGVPLRKQKSQRLQEFLASKGERAEQLYDELVATFSALPRGGGVYYNSGAAAQAADVICSRFEELGIGFYFCEHADIINLGNVIEEQWIVFVDRCIAPGYVADHTLEAKPCKTSRKQVSNANSPTSSQKCSTSKAASADGIRCDVSKDSNSSKGSAGISEVSTTDSPKVQSATV